MPVDQADTPPHTVPVQRLRPGDHGFVRYDRDGVRWELAAAYARGGLENGERVLLLTDPKVPRADGLARLGSHAPGLPEAGRRGHLVLGTMRELIAPAKEFTAQRQWDRIREETTHAIREGYRGVRAFIDMAWVPDLGLSLDAVIRRENCSEHLFATGDYSELCAYDGRWFSEEVLGAMSDAHPRNVLAGLGMLRTVYADGSVRLIGDADLNTRVAFVEALRDGLAQTTRTRYLVVDLTQLHFLGVSCATDLLLLASGADGHDRVEVRCGPFQANTLRRLGAALVAPLALVEVESGC